MGDFQVLRTDLETGKTDVSFRVLGTSETTVKGDVERLNNLSKKDFTMNHYSYREVVPE